MSPPRPHRGEHTHFIDLISRPHDGEHLNAYHEVYFVYSFYGFRSLLSEEELKQLEEACDMALELNQSKHRIYEYVESKMSFIAPNLSVIVGASTAAKIMGEIEKDLF